MHAPIPAALHPQPTPRPHPQPSPAPYLDDFLDCPSALRFRLLLPLVLSFLAPFLLLLRGAALQVGDGEYIGHVELNLGDLMAEGVGGMLDLRARDGALVRGHDKNISAIYLEVVSPFSLQTKP